MKQNQKPNADVIAAKFNEELEASRSLIESFPFENKAAYADLLAQTYFFVRHTTNFIALGIVGLSFSHRKLSVSLQAHLSEERGHELLLLRDIKALGYSINDFEESPETTALVHSQYFHFHNGTPFAHFGYAFFLEGLAANFCPQISKRVRESHGEASVSFYRVHGDEDISHFAKGLKLLDEANGDELQSVFKNLQFSRHFYHGILKSILAKNSETKNERSSDLSKAS